MPSGGDPLGKYGADELDSLMTKRYGTHSLDGGTFSPHSLHERGVSTSCARPTIDTYATASFGCAPGG